MKRSLKVVTILMVLLAVGTAGAWAQAKAACAWGWSSAIRMPCSSSAPRLSTSRFGYNFAAPGYLFLSADYRIVSGYQIVDFLHFFLGVGACTIIQFEPGDFSLGARIPLGVQVFLIDNVLELFLEVAPTVGFIPALVAFPEWQGFIGFTILIPRR